MWMRLLFGAAAAKVAIGLILATFPPLHARVDPPALPTWYYVALLTIFAIAGGWLYFGGWRDVRAQLLGTLLPLFGSLFTDRLITRAAPLLPPGIADALQPVVMTPLIAFCPYVFWQFALLFPRPLPTLDLRLQQGTSMVTLATAFTLIAANVAAGFAAPDSALAAATAWLAPTAEGLFWQILSLLTIPSIVLLVVKLRRSAIDERRRLVWVVAAIVVGNMPMVAHVLVATIVPAYGRWAADPVTSRALGITLTAFTLIIPAAVAYAVRVDHVLDVRFVVRRAVQYALARYTVIAGMVGLIIAVAYVGYGNRARPLSEIVTTSPGLVAMVIALAVVLASRRRLLDAIDRRFFRDHYDARQILVNLVERSEKAQSARDVIALITAEIDRALHLERVALLLRDETGDTLRDPDGRVRAMDTSGPLASLISGSRTPLDVDLATDTSALARLPESDREWLVDAGARMIVPLFGTRGTIGAILLGDKRSELPFTPEDRKLMMAVAASAALTLEQRLVRESPDPETPPATPRSSASECVSCGRVQPRQQRECHACGGATRDSLLPTVLAGKFEVERQIGAGGMGVVYRARDLSLNRPVAMKVLPRVGAQAAARLRREARAMALMQHGQLAVVHALESWRGAPVLVLEYLAGGTLADRIRQGPLPFQDVITIGVAMCDALRHVHNSGYLHRDVKPSNIGFTSHGTSKLLDFGLVQLVSDLSGTASTAFYARAAHGDDDRHHQSHLESAGTTSVHQFIGTPAYMSPEAIAMEPPSPGVDLWGLAVSLYEAIAGRNPFTAPTLADTVKLVMACDVPDVRKARPDCPEGLAVALATALSPNRLRRPHSAEEFALRLRMV